MKRLDGKPPIRLADYLKNPKPCEYCTGPILPIEGKYLRSDRTRFCSRMCAARFQHADYPVDKIPLNGGNPPKPRKCSVCKNTWFKDREDWNQGGSLRCKDCRVKQGAIDKQTKAETKMYQIRQCAKIAMNGRKKTCQRCGYSLSVDVCHIKPVSKFPPTALISEVNAKDNLAYLCPNCHRELDRGLIKDWGPQNHA